MSEWMVVTFRDANMGDVVPETWAGIGLRVGDNDEVEIGWLAYSADGFPEVIAHDRLPREAAGLCACLLAIASGSAEDVIEQLTRTRGQDRDATLEATAAKSRVRYDSSLGQGGGLN